MANVLPFLQFYDRPGFAKTAGLSPDDIKYGLEALIKNDGASSQRLDAYYRLTGKTFSFAKVARYRFAVEDTPEQVLAILDHFPSLTSIDLSGRLFTTDEEVELLAARYKLDEIDLRNCLFLTKISAVAISRIPSLKSVRLAGSNFSGQWVQILADRKVNF